MTMPRVAIFLNQSLPLSEVFVAHQAKALRRYAPTLVACRKVSPHVETGLPEIILNRSGFFGDQVREAVFKASGHSPFLLKAVQNSDIVHAHFGPTGWLASQLTIKAKKPLVVTFHGFDVLKNKVTPKKDGLLQTLYAANRAKLAERASAFICVSEYVKQRAVQFGFPIEKCHVVYLGIPLPEHKAAKPARKSEQPFRLFAAGRLVPFKGHKKLIEAIAIIQNAGHNVALDIAGDGPLREALETQAAASLKNYKFHGALRHDKMISLMRGADLFCHTAMHMENGQTEALGLVVLEAQWAGLPVVAFRSGGVPEAMEDGKTGILCDEGDAEAFAGAVIRLITDPARYEAMAGAAPEFVATRFDNRDQTDKLEALYDRVIENYGREPA